MRLKVITNTTFKETTLDSSKLAPEAKVSVLANRVFNIHSWKVVDRDHLRIALLGEFLGEPPRNTWYVYIPHVQLIDDRGRVVPIQPTQPKTVRRSGSIPTTKRLSIPHKSQLDNALNPRGACNVTSFAMVMAYFRIKRLSSVGQLEDELYRYMEGNSLSRWEPDDLARAARSYGLRDDFTTRGKLTDLRWAIAGGYPCIIHGYFTSFGHIMVVRGYDQNGFFVNDPFGEWTASGYRNDLSGENLHYSNNLIQSKCSPEGENFMWIHRLSKRVLPWG